MDIDHRAATRLELRSTGIVRAMRHRHEQHRALRRIPVFHALALVLCGVLGLRWLHALAFMRGLGAGAECNDYRLPRVSCLAATAEESGVDTNRRELLGVSVAAATTFGAVGPSHAAIPMLEEFSIDSGSVVAPSEAEVAARRAASEEAWATALGASLPTAAQRALDALDVVDDYLKQQDYENARLVLARPDLVIIGVRISPSRAKVVPKGVWATLPTTRLLDTQTYLQQLEEWCFTHRVIYFNSADLRQVQQRPETKKALEKIAQELEEPMEYLAQSRAAIREFLA